MANSTGAARKLEGKVAIITGAVGLVGSAVARLFVKHGAQVIVADISDDKGHTLVSELGPSAHYKRCDVTKEEDIALTVDFAIEKFGKLDIMLNNAVRRTAPDWVAHNFQTLDMSLYDEFTSLVTRATVMGIKHAARVMVPVEQGVIINTGSTLSFRTGSDVPLIYNLNKSYLPPLTKIAASQLGKHGIRVNTICPHFLLNDEIVQYFKSIGKDMTFEAIEEFYFKDSPLLRRRGKDEDVANAFLYLCSDDGGYVSGHDLVIDGGWINRSSYNILGNPALTNSSV